MQNFGQNFHYRASTPNVQPGSSQSRKPPTQQNIQDNTRPTTVTNYGRRNYVMPNKQRFPEENITIQDEGFTQPVTFSADKAGPYDHNLGSHDVRHNVERGHQAQSNDPKLINTEAGIYEPKPEGPRDYSLASKELQHNVLRGHTGKDFDDQRPPVTFEAERAGPYDHRLGSEELRHNVEFGHKSKEGIQDPDKYDKEFGIFSAENEGPSDYRFARPEMKRNIEHGHESKLYAPVKGGGVYSAREAGPYDHRLASREVRHNVERGHRAMRGEDFIDGEQDNTFNASNTGPYDYTRASKELKHNVERGHISKAYAEGKIQNTEEYFYPANNQGPYDVSLASHELRHNVERGHKSKAIFEGLLSDTRPNGFDVTPIKELDPRFGSYEVKRNIKYGHLSKKATEENPEVIEKEIDSLHGIVSAENEGPYDHRLASKEVKHNVERGHLSKDIALGKAHEPDEEATFSADQAGPYDHRLGSHDVRRNVESGHYSRRFKEEIEKNVRSYTDEELRRLIMFVTYGNRIRIDPSLASKEVRRNVEHGHLSKEMGKIFNTAPSKNQQGANKSLSYTGPA